MGRWARPTLTTMTLLSNVCDAKVEPLYDCFLPGATELLQAERFHSFTVWEIWCIHECFNNVRHVDLHGSSWFIRFIVLRGAFGSYELVVHFVAGSCL